MKNNTEEAKNLLKRASRALPSDFTLFEVRRYVSLAIQKIEDIEKKREKNSLKQEERNKGMILKNNFFNKEKTGE